jgi:hypothetical protein
MPRVFESPGCMAPEANYSDALPSLNAAARKLNEGDEAGAQQALDASGLTRLSSDGAVLMRAVAGSLGIGPLDLPFAEGPRLWRAEDIAAHLPLFKDFAPVARLLAKAGGWDESKHPRWPAGSGDRHVGPSTVARAGLKSMVSQRRKSQRRLTRLLIRLA